MLVAEARQQYLLYVVFVLRLPTAGLTESSSEEVAESGSDGEYEPAEQRRQRARQVSGFPFATSVA